MKLIIQIPAFNEEEAIARTIAELPKKIEGFDSIEVLVIDDGSRDATIARAKQAGAQHIVRLISHRGLSTAFLAGIDASLQLGADVIVNTDADNQYRATDIPKIVAPIVEGTAEVVIGDRGVGSSPHMSPLKKFLQRFGSWAVGAAAGVRVPDATSGLRAFSREAAFQINVFNPFTYTLETIIQSGVRNFEIRSVPVGTNPPVRPSRLYRGMGSYLRKSIVTIFRVYTLYRPLKTFFFFGALLLLCGIALGARFLVFYAIGHGGGHLQSLILAAILMIVGFQTILIGLVADLISVNRRLSEEVLIRIRKLEQPQARKPRARPQSARPPVPPETQWVWLIDEKKIAEQAGEPAAEQPAAKGSSRRRRRRRGGMRSVPDHAATRERKPHPHPRNEETGEE